MFDGLTPERLADRRAVLTELDRLRRQGDQSRLRGWDELHRRAYTLLASREEVRTQYAFYLRDPARSRRPCSILRSASSRAWRKRAGSTGQSNSCRMTRSSPSAARRSRG